MIILVSGKIMIKKIIIDHFKFIDYKDNIETINHLKYPNFITT